MILYNDASNVNLSAVLNEPETLRRVLNGFDSMELAACLTDEELQRFCGLLDEGARVREGEYEKNTVINRILQVFGFGKSPKFIGKMTYKEFDDCFWSCRDDFAQLLDFANYDELKKARKK